VGSPDWAEGDRQAGKMALSLSVEGWSKLSRNLFAAWHGPGLL
jgi:hypothetical protein